MRATLAVLVCVSAGALAAPLLIRPVHVYQGLIQGVRDYFNNTCVILFHASSYSAEAEGLEEIEGLLALQRYFSGALNVRTAIMDFRMFENRVGRSYHRIKRPLFVLLNDLEEIEEQFALVSEWIAMAYPTWLVFLRDESRPEVFLRKVRTPFDCALMLAQRDPRSGGGGGGGGEIVREAYRLDGGDAVRSSVFGSWSAERGFRGPRLGLYQRRHDLHGRVLRVASVHDPPVARILREPNGGRILGIGGFFGEVIELLREGTNCTFAYEEASSWGVRLPNGTWTGAIRMLLEGEADLVAAALMMTSDRLDAVAFTTPVYASKCRAYIKRPDSRAVKWSAYLAPFAGSVWNAVALAIALASLAVAGIDAIGRSLGRHPREPLGLPDALLLAFAAFCSQAVGSFTVDSVRLVQLSVHATAVVVLAAYSAALISYLAVKTFAMPFTTMEGLLADGSYRFAVLADSADYSFFQNTSDPVLTVMFEELLAGETELPATYLDGVTRLCRERKYAFMMLDSAAAVLGERAECALEPLDAMMQSTIAMAVPIASPYRGLINANVLLLRDSGILQRLLKLERSSGRRRAKAGGWTSVELEDATPLLVFLLSAFLLAWVALLAERLVSRICRDRGSGAR